MVYSTPQIGPHLTINFKGLVVKNDALPTPQRTQMWAQVENKGRGRSRGTLSVAK
jgi:hypothetical protein